jgi:hypothetical protein
MNELSQRRAAEILEAYATKGNQAIIEALDNEDGGEALGEMIIHHLRGFAAEHQLTLNASARLGIEVTAASEDAEEVVEDNGFSFDTLNDGSESQEEPIVQELTHDDGGVEPADEQELLMDDISSSTK